MATRAGSADDAFALELPARHAEIERLREQVREVEERNRQLDEALRTRIVIEQAKGVLVERFRLEPDAAFLVLRSAARSSRRRIHELAADVVGSRSTPPELRSFVGGPSPRPAEPSVDGRDRS